MEWLNELIELCMDGVIYYDPATGPRLIDFAIPTEDGVLIASVGWWDAVLTGGSFMSALTFLEDFKIIKGPANNFAVVDASGNQSLLAAPEDRETRDAASAHRLETDLRRYVYLEALEVAAELIEGKQFIDWMAAYMLRPRVTTQTLLQKEMTQLRKTGTIMLVDGTGAAVDALVFDQTGRAATAGIDNWLTGMARVWTDLPPADRPTLRDFAESLQGQGYADKYLDKPSEIEARGPLTNIASALLAR